MAHVAATGLMVVGVALTACLALPSSARAQLISPGKLTEAHAGLEGLRQCTQCHQRGEDGVANDLCLVCHEPLAERLTRDAGLHAEYRADECGSCHKEHIGRDADIVRFASDQFEHERAGFELVGSHGALDCAACHNRELVRDPTVRRFKAAGGALDDTFLGLGTNCMACHARDDPHQDQFEAKSCDTCHGQTEWSGAPGFEHDQARFQLTGRHMSLDCTACHATRQLGDGRSTQLFRPLEFGSCLSCHDDEHDGSLGSDCTECHSTSAWSGIPRSSFETRFDHGRTTFALTGAHGESDCSACHRPPTNAANDIRIRFSDRGTASYPAPIVDRECLSCHVDRHEGEFDSPDDYAECMACHTEHEWSPSTFDLFRHEATTFPLVGAHLAVECASCHAGPSPEDRWTFALGVPTCAQCHREDGPHGDQFAGRACTDCHTERSFRIDAFDHAGTGYLLEGAHVDLGCETCHRPEPGVAERSGPPVIRYTPLPTTCSGCHPGVGRSVPVGMPAP